MGTNHIYQLNVKNDLIDFYPHQGLFVKLPPTLVDRRITVVVVETKLEFKICNYKKEKNHTWKKEILSN